jgi:site-specific recombinase XerD
MASVYKRRYRRGDGKLVECEKHTVECKVGDRFVRLPGYTDRRASEEMGRKVERLAGLREAGEQLDAALAKWLEGLSGKLRKRLAELELLDGAAVASTKPLTAHLETYRQALLDGGASPRQKGPATPQHAKLAANRIQAILDGAGMRFLSQVTAPKVTRYLAERRAKGLSVKSSNHYLTAIKAFLNWMVRERMATENPLAHVPKLQVTEKARRHVRRALDVDELRALLEVTAKGPERYGMTGPARAMLYRLAAESGLRASELRSLTRASFKLDGLEPYVWLPGDDTKNRQAATLPLRPGTAAQLAAFLAGKLPSAAAFSMPNVTHVAEMLRADLEAARVKWLSAAPSDAERKRREESAFLAERDDAGRVVDFHSLRVTFCTLLAAAGVSVKTLQSLARHSTPVLTLNTYTRTVHGSGADAVNRLPDLSGPGRQALGATGTESITPDACAPGRRTGGTTGGNTARDGSATYTAMRRSQWGSAAAEASQAQRVQTDSGAPERTELNWARLDSNQRRLTPTGLQPVPFSHSGTRPTATH